jgi:hypothetical protein
MEASRDISRRLDTPGPQRFFFRSRAFSESIMTSAKPEEASKTVDLWVGKE